MKGFIPRTALGLGLSLFTLAGCAAYRDIVDPCWPERYNYMARQEVKEGFAPQVQNGHVLDQTVWNYHFEAKKTGEPGDQLNAAGFTIVVITHDQAVASHVGRMIAISDGVLSERVEADHV